MILLLAKGVGMGGSAVAVAVPASYEKNFLTMQIDCDLGMVLGLKTAFTDLKEDLEALIFFMGGR